MATVSNRQVGIDARRKTASGRMYEIEGKKLPSVTNILGVINKPALIGWAGKVEREACIQAAADYYRDLCESAPIERGVFMSDLTARIGKQKAATKELEAAAEIGSQAHNKIEWTLRKQLGFQVGPEPKVCDAAKWAFMSFQDWAKEVHLKPLRIEQVVYSMEYGYAGTMDLVAMVDGRKTLIDFKTGKAIYAEAYIQTAAYREAIKEMRLEVDIYEGMIVRLPKVQSDPEFEAVIVPDVDYHFQAFVHAIALWHWQQKQEEVYRAKMQSIKEGAA